MMNCRTRILAGATILVGWLGSGAVGQVPTSLPTPPNAVRLLMIESEQSLSSGDFGGAVDALQQLLDLEEDYFDPQAEGRSIKRHAERTLRLLPAEGLRAYQRRYGPEAETLLAEARRAGGDETLNEVIRRYAMTDAGAVAIELLAARLWDRGALLAAGRLFDRLLDHPGIDDAERVSVLARSAVCWWGCGNASRARDRLTAWSRLASASGESSGAPFPIATVDVNAAMDWLAEASRHVAVAPRDTGERITAFRGDAQRSGVLDRATPTGGVVWSYPAIDEHDSWIEGRIAEITNEFGVLESEIHSRAGQEHAVLPSGVPVIAGNRLVFRGYASLKWVDPASGELICYGADRDQSFVHLAEHEWRSEDDWHWRHLQLLLGQRGWRDSTCGTLCCDDRYVYSIFNSGIVSAMGPTVQSIGNVASHPLAPRSFNLLAAYEVDLGRFIWEQGGPPRAGDEKLTGVYFLGPPLPLDGLLYCLVDDRKQVRLVVIDPALDPDVDDEIIWEQPLYNAEHHLSSPAAEGRRLSGLTPSASGDVLVCPTGESMLVAVDRRTRRLLWTFQYRELPRDPQAQQIAVLMAQRQSLDEEQLLIDLLEDDHWCDSAPIIVGEHVLYTPPDQDELLCLRLTDGRLVWREDRQDGVYVAGVHDGNAIIVGSSRIRAIRLETGESAWPESIPIPAPSGRGFQHDRYYVLPLSSREIASIDLRDARILTRSPTNDWMPGNLFGVRGRIYSQTAGGVVAFASLEDQNRRIAERLAEDPDDFDALALRGEQRLHLGDVAAGIGDLRRCLQMADNGRARALLASTLIEGLRVDFATYRDAADEIDHLVREPEQRARFLRLLAGGLQRSGDIVAAFEAFLGFAGEGITESVREETDGRRLVRSDHWVRARIGELYSEAEGSARVELDELIAETIAEAVRAGDVGRLRDLSVMLPLPAHVEPLRLALADQLDREVDAAEIELQLIELLGSTNPETQSAATARLLELYLQDGEASAVPFLAARLSGPDAERRCLDGLTGAELLDKWDDDESYRELLHPANIWPVEQVEASGSRRALPPLYAVTHLGPPSETLRDWRFYVDMTGNTLQAYDGQGEDRWHVPIGQSAARRGQPANGYARYVRTLGRLALLVTNDAFFILDALADDGEPRVLVNDPLFQFQERAATFMARFQVQIRPGVNPRGGLRNQIRATNGQTSGNVGPIRGSGLIYQQGSTIRAIDPLSGEELWRRESPEIPAGAEIMADNDYVIVWPPNRESVVVLRSADGATVQHTDLPRGVLNPQPDGDWERCVVLESADRRPGTSTRRLALFDPVSESFRWELQFEDLLDWTVVDGRDFALLREGGQCMLIDGLTGEERCSTTLDDPLAQTISVDRFLDRLLVMTASESTPDKIVQPWSDLDFPVVHGQATLLNLDDGRPVWSRRIEHQTYVRNLPGRWPVLAFAASIVEPGREPVENYTAVLLLDRMTGDILHEGVWDRSANKFGWLSRPDRHRLELSFGLESVSLQFGRSSSEPMEDDPNESGGGDSTE